MHQDWNLLWNHLPAWSLSNQTLYLLWVRTIRSHCNKFWEESIELHYCFSRPFYGIDNTKSCSMLNLTTFDECGFYFTFLTCMDVHHFILSYWAITTSINNYRHEVACCQVLWYICSMHTSYSIWKFPACISCSVLLSNFNSFSFIKLIHPCLILIWSSFYIKSMDSMEQVLKLRKECLVQTMICLRCWSISWFHFVDVLTKCKYMLVTSFMVLIDSNLIEEQPLTNIDLFQKFDMFLWMSGFQNALVHTDFDMFVDE